MRCLFVIPEMSVGGSERQLGVLARELQAAGHTVRILALHAPRRPLPIDSELDLHVLNAPRPHTPLCMVALTCEIRRFRPDVLHTFLFGFDLWANLAARSLHVPCIVSSRRELAVWQTARHRIWQNAANRLVDAVVANSQAAADYAYTHERFIQRGAYYTIPNAFEPPLSNAGAVLPLPSPHGKTLVNIANFWPGKGHGQLVKALALLNEPLDASLWLVGEGEGQETIRNLARGLNLGDRVHFLGCRHDIAAILSRADLYVHASRMESSPNAILEAMGCGVPVVACACGGVPELLDGGELGVLAPVGDVAALSRAMSAVFAESVPTKAMAERARDTALARHAPRQIARRYERVYRMVARRPLPDKHHSATRALSVALYTVGDVKQPSARCRVMQYIPCLQESGFRVIHFGLPSARTCRFGSFLSLLRHAWRRRRQLAAFDRFDHVLVQKALTPSRWCGLCSRLETRARGFVYDIDDDVLTGGGCLPFRKPLDRLQNPGESAWLARHASRVMAGNDELAERCAAYNPAVVTIPTVVDCRRYWSANASGSRAEDQPLRLVWVGQRSTMPYLAVILPHLQRAASLSDLRKFGLVLRIVCDRIDGIDTTAFAPLRIEFVPWRLDGEVDGIVGAHVGLMPLANDEWCRGKCGFKALQYMALGIPAIVSPVGVNACIVEHAVNGYHARKPGDWVRGIEMLAQHEPLRREMGRRARQRILADYSLQRWADEWMREVTGGVA